MSGSPLRVGVLGCANIARRSMIPALLASDGLELAGVASRSAEKAAATATEFGCEPFTGYAALLADPSIDAVYVPLPTGLHEEWVLAALDAGKHALVEKSFAMDVASALTLLDRARVLGLLVVENFLFPLHSQTAWVLDALAEGRIGQLRLFRATFCFPHRSPDDIRYDAALGGGALLDAGAYGVRAVRLFLGEDVAYVGSTRRVDCERGVDVHGTAQFQTPGGVVAQISYGIGLEYQCTWEFLGTEGRLVLERAFTPPPGFRPTAHLTRGGEPETICLPADDYYANMWLHFADAVHDPAAHANHREDIVRQSELLEAVRERSQHVNDPIYVTRPSLAPLEEYVEHLRTIWESGIMTHHGPLVQRLEKQLEAYLDVPHAVCLSNGTSALSASIRALDLTGEIITTPFTFVATGNVIRWERCTPVFVDIDPDTWNLDPALIEAAITPETSAILPVHVFGRPCDTTRIDAIAEAHGLKVIYDGAHAMCVEQGGRSVLTAGTVTAVSFHATKLFNTAEGGACVTEDDALADRIRRSRFFGFDERKDIVDEGTNFKMTEVAAALGLANLPHLERVRRSRQASYEAYVECVRDLPFLTLQHFDDGQYNYNYSYMPVVFDTEERLLRVEAALHAERIFPRRYFHPALHTVAHFGPQPSLPVAERIARGVLCLPLYDGLALADIERVCSVIAAA